MKIANKLVKLISELPYNDLILLKKDLDAGNIEKLIKQQIKIKKTTKTAICPVCGEEIKESEGFHLEFGPPGLRKKATFDGADCMQYFIEHQLKKRTMKETRQ